MFNDSLYQNHLITCHLSARMACASMLFLFPNYQSFDCVLLILNFNDLCVITKQNLFTFLFCFNETGLAFCIWWSQAKDFLVQVLLLMHWLWGEGYLSLQLLWDLEHLNHLCCCCAVPHIWHPQLCSASSQKVPNQGTVTAPTRSLKQETPLLWATFLRVVSAVDRLWKLVAGEMLNHMSMVAFFIVTTKHNPWSGTDFWTFIRSWHKYSH